MNDGYISILKSIASSNPTPGGGSVAALSLAHAHSLATMVSHLTLKSDKWSEGHGIANMIVQNSDERIDEAITLAENDAVAFDAVMAAYRLPKDEDGSTKRSDSIREATIGAALTPLETAQAAHSLLKQILVLCHGCNSNALTDLAASAELARTAAIIAQMNVRINTEYVSGNDVDAIEHDIDNVITDCEKIMSQLRATCMDRLGW